MNSASPTPSSLGGVTGTSTAPAAVSTASAASTATSRTLRAIGPGVSCEWLIGTTCVRLTRPIDGFNPTRPLIDDGHTTDPSVSVPTAAAAKLAATAAPEPDDDPHARQATRGRRHPIGGFDIVLDQHRHAMQRPPDTPRLAFGIQRLRLRQRVGIDRDDAAQCRPLAIQRGDPVEIGARHLDARRLARGHQRLHLLQRHLFDRHPTRDSRRCKHRARQQKTQRDPTHIHPLCGGMLAERAARTRAAVALALKIIGGIVLALVIAFGLTVTIVPRFLDRIYYEGDESDHYDGQRFFNPDGDQDTMRMPTGGSRTGFFWRYLTGNDGRPEWPKSVTVTPSRPAARIDGDRMVVTWIGHASVLIQTHGLNILTDPIYAERAGPFGFGPQRVAAPGIRFDDLPKIDLVLVSHNHYDHLDQATLKRLHRPDRRGGDGTRLGRQRDAHRRRDSGHQQRHPL
ncbi:hypothetical protein WR25_22571 [Diploscapter pachys]|uniref:Metallo-beta-lactamase domain-containing protein n=1 Tax=Diploscapter pachys TaxID=2018661 RepID=A0A2A2K456_9BILA|nr:hypothetical protein WR25_22571 [Diploscapter pachys]